MGKVGRKKKKEKRKRSKRGSEYSQPTGLIESIEGRESIALCRRVVRRKRERTGVVALSQSLSLSLSLKKKSAPEGPFVKKYVHEDKAYLF